MVATSGAGWKLAPSLVGLEKEANKIAPARSKASDGSIASSAHHAQNPGSDHEVGARDEVHGLDLTNDPDAGWDSHARLDELRRRQDPRSKYGISNAQMWSSYPVPGYPAWSWRPYRGPNPHRTHGHLSILSTPQAENDTSPWFPATPAPRRELIATTGQGEVMITLFHPLDKNRADDLWIAPDRSVRHRFYDGVWHPEENLGGSASSVSASWRNDGAQLRLVVAGVDGPYENVWDTAKGAWRGFSKLPGQLPTEP